MSHRVGAAEMAQSHDETKGSQRKTKNEIFSSFPPLFLRHFVAPRDFPFFHQSLAYSESLLAAANPVATLMYTI